MIWDEPARGTVPDPSFASLSGLDRGRAYLRGEVGRPPFSRLTGISLTQISTGSASVTMPASSWFGIGDGSLESQMVLAQALEWTVLTSASEGHDVVPATIAVHNLRPALPEVQSFIARGRVVHAGPRFTVAEVHLEDAVGRPVAHATGSAMVVPLDPPPPAPFAPAPFEEPSYASADPHLRPLAADAALSRQHIEEYGWIGAIRKALAGELPGFPLFQLLGIRVVEHQEGRGVVALRTSDWLRTRSANVCSAALAGFGRVGLSAPVASVAPRGFRIRLLDYNLSFLRAAVVDGRELIARSAITHEAGPVFVSSGEVIDADGAVLAVGRMTALLFEDTSRRESRPEPERVLASVLFTDVVDSTAMAEKLGDAAWAELLADHHAAVRRQLETWKGREVKTTGDGFLATFDSPARALQCARGVRDALRRLGLEVRAGVHTGECEVSRDDVSGIAVHAAARVMGAAGPGDILVSSTVKELVAGSGLRFSDRGRHQLKGIDGEWQLYALAD